MDQKSLETQWAAYAVESRANRAQCAWGGAVVVAGAAVFSLQSQANAGIVYTPVGKTITWNNTNPNLTTKPGSKTYNIPLPGNAGVKFEGYFIKSTSLLHGQSGKGAVGGVKAIVGQIITNGNSASQGVKKLASGDMITGGANFKSVSNVKTFQAPLHVKSGGKTLGSFPIGENYFVGFKLSDGDLGYIELAVGNNAGNAAYANELTIVDYAFNNVSGAAIAAGQLPAVPEPQASTSILSLLLLAGAAGSLKAWRERKAQAQTRAQAV